MNLFEKISEWWHGKYAPYEFTEESPIVGVHHDRHSTARLVSWFLRWKVLATIGTIIVGVAGIISAFYAVRTYHNPPPSPPSAITAQPKSEYQSRNLTNNNPIKRDSNKLSHPQPPPVKEKLIDPPKTVQPQQINAPNSAISIGQSGGITAHTINVGQQERRVMPDQREILIQKLKNSSIHPIEVSFSSGVPEQRHFAEAIIEALKAAGCEIIISSAVQWVTPYTSGVAVIMNSDTQPKGAGILQRAFKEAKIDTQWYGYPDAKRDIFRIIVSAMP